MKTITENERKTPVIAEADVIVVGGGAGGIGAALAAGRSGVNTLLLERANCLGGLQTQCLNPRFTQVDPDVTTGIVLEICEKVDQEGMVLGRPGFGDARMRSISFEPEYYKLLTDNLMDEAGVKILYHAFVVAAIREGNTLKGVIIESKEGRQAVLGKVIIDATGAAEVAWKCGAPVMSDGFPRGPGKGRHMGFGYAVAFRQVDTVRFEEYRKAHPDEWRGPITGKSLVKKGKEEGKLHPHFRGAFWISPHFSPGSIWILGPHYPLPMGHHGWLLEDLSKGEIDMRQQAFSGWKLLRDNVPGWENSKIDQLPVHLMLRDSHRMTGMYVLKEDEMRAGKAFDDSVAVSNHAPDVFGPDDQHEFVGNVPPFDIPYRSLVSSGIDNLMGVGACLSTDFITFAATRYCTPSICTGQAAGTAAGLAVKNKVTPKKVKATLVQKALRKQNVITTVKEISKPVLDEYRERVKNAPASSMGPDNKIRVLA